MHADGDWQAVEGVLNKDMAIVGEYLQTWKQKLSTTKTALAAFQLHNKEAKRELTVNYSNETLPFCPEPKYLGVTLDRSLTPADTSQEADITHCSLVMACWLRSGVLEQQCCI